MDAEYERKWKSYFDPEVTDEEVFRNKLGIKNDRDLLEAEAKYCFNRLIELYEKPIEGNFDKNHLRAIHRYLFQDVYDWAGEFRTVHMGKNHSSFSPVGEIEAALDADLANLNEELFHVYGADSLACLLAEYYVVLLNIHPFRDGNGRTVREFLREFTEAKTKGWHQGEYTLDWTKVDSEELSKLMPNGRTEKTLIENEFRKALSPISDEKNVDRSR